MGLQKNFGLVDVVAVDLTDATTVVATTGTITNSVTVPAGYIYQLTSLYISIPDPAGSGSGAHDLTMQIGSLSSPKLKASSNTGKNIRFTNGNFNLFDTIEPNDIAIQNKILFEQTFVSEDETLKFYYTNTTDVNQTGSRQIKLVFKKYRVI